MEKPFLLSTSSIFENSQIIDNIRQSNIDLKGNVAKKDVQNLLNEAISTLTKEINLSFFNELSSLISACFLLYPAEFLPIFEDFFQKSRLNQYKIFATASILAVLTHVRPHLHLYDYYSFITDALNELLPQIQKKDIKSIYVFRHEIPNQVKYDFVIDLLLSSKLTKELLTNFIDFLKSQKFYIQNQKFLSLLKYIIEDGFTHLLDPEILKDLILYKCLSTEELATLIPCLSDELFIKYFHDFETTFIGSPHLTASFIIKLLDKCDELNLKLQKIERVFNFLSPSELTNQIIHQLKKYDLIIPKEFVDCFKNVENENDFKMINIYSDVFVNLNEKERLPEKSNDFQFNGQNSQISKESLNKEELLDNLIFKKYPPNSKNIDILLDFIKSVYKDKLESFFSIETDQYLLHKILEKNDILPPIGLIKLINSKTVFESIQKAENEKDKNHQHLPLLIYVYS